MAWGNAGNVITTNLDNDADDPSLARADLEAGFVELQAVINGRNTTNGVAGLDSNGLIVNTVLPNTIISSVGNDLTLDPDTDKVLIQDIINLNPQTTAQLNARTDAAEGDVAYCSDGDGGSKCAAVYNGTNWVVISFGSTISAT